MLLKAHLLLKGVVRVFQVIVSFIMRGEGGEEQEYGASMIVEGVCFEHSGTHPRMGERVRFWRPDAPAILLVADVVAGTDGTSVMYVVPGDEWVNTEVDGGLTPLLAQYNQATFVGHLKAIGFEVKVKQ